MKVPCHDPRFYFEVNDGNLNDLQIIREIFCENVYEVLAGDLDDTGIVVDIGANVGVFSVYAAGLADEATVYAVEPEPHNIELLADNIVGNKLQKKITHVPMAVGAYDGTTIISNEGGGSTIKDGKEGATVGLATLETLWRHLKLEFVDVLKIDVEGAESDIILNAPRHVIALSRYITLEFDIRTKDRLGDLVSKLSETHQLKIVGSHETGGMIFARRY